MLLLLVTVLILLSLLLLLPAYTILLAFITIIRANYFLISPQQQTDCSGDNVAEKEKKVNGHWSSISTSIFQGRVFHVRQRPKVHSFQYPLTFSVVDLDEASDLFGSHAVATGSSEIETSGEVESENRGRLWPLSTLMLLQDEDHMKNGEGLTTSLPKEVSNEGATSPAMNRLSMKERIANLVYERTNGKLNLKDQPQRKILLVTHLKYYGYCFNPVSFFFILNQQQDEIEAVVVEVSNTPWNEMSIYVLHPDSVDTTFSQVYSHDSSKSLAKDGTMKSKTYHYQCEKKFHVSPFMTMDHDYDWKFQLEKDRIVVQAQMYKHATTEDDVETNKEEEKKNGTIDSEMMKKRRILYFTAGFDIQRTIDPTTQSYPLQLSKIILRYPIYCFVIQIWIHYEALKLLMKGIQFIPHPEGSETGASKAIAVVMGPVFLLMDMMNDLYARFKSGGDKKTKSD